MKTKALSRCSMRMAHFRFFFPLVALLMPGLSAAPKNVLLICVDDLKPMIGAYGDKTVKTPNMDKLAAKGLLFERAYCNQAICSPSRNALIAGLRPDTLGIYDLATNFRKAVPDAVTMPQYFIKHGYRTEAIGKILHTGHDNDDDMASWSVPPWKGEAARPRGEGVKKPTKADRAQAGAAGKKERGPAFTALDVEDDAYPDGRYAGEIVKRLEAAKAKPEQPFFIAAGFLKPHLPFTAPKKYWDLYDPASFQLPSRTTPPDSAPKYAAHQGGELRQYEGIPADGVLSDELSRKLIHGYHAAVSYADAQIGKVLDAVERLGLSDDTIIVLWGDHGWHLGDHGIWCKHTNFEEATRIPLMIVAPGVTKAGTRTKAFVTTVDLYPTLAELAGFPVKEDGPKLDGKSLVKVLGDPTATVNDHAFHVYPRGGILGRAIRTDSLRFVEWKKPGASSDTAEIELYDYAADPGETKNIAAEREEQVKEMKAMLAKYPEAKRQISHPKESEESPAKPKQDRGRMFDSRDGDKDGKLTMEEFLTNQPDGEKAKPRFGRFDKNSDGALSREEFIGAGN